MTSDTEGIRLVVGEWWLGQLFAHSIVAAAVDKLAGWAPLLQLAVEAEAEEAEEAGEVEVAGVQERADKLVEERLGQKRTVDNKNKGMRVHRSMDRNWNIG